MAAKRNVLMVYAHQEPKSFNGALRDVAVETLRGQGHDVEVSALYEMNFNASAMKSDFKGMPAIMKGWIDRCLAEDVSFGIGNGKWYDNGPFKNKKIMLSMTTGGTRGYFSNTGIFGDMNVILWPIHNALRITGIHILAPQLCYMSETTHDERATMLDSWKSRLLSVWSEEPLSFVNIDNFDSENEFKLKENYVKQFDDCKAGPSVGQNLGRKFLPDSMLKSGINLQQNDDKRT